MKPKINQISPENKEFDLKKVFPCIFIFIIGIMFILPGQGYTTASEEPKNKDIETLKDPENSILHTPFVTKEPVKDTVPLSVITANELKTKLEVVEEKLDHLSDTMRFYHYGFIFLIIFALVGLGLLILLIIILKNDLGKIIYRDRKRDSIKVKTY
jgi:hypothetical protein